MSTSGANITEDRQMYTLYWVSEDKQGELPMGQFETIEAAQADIHAARAELVEQCNGDEDRIADIWEGYWTISEND